MVLLHQWGRIMPSTPERIRRYRQRQRELRALIKTIGKPVAVYTEYRQGRLSIRLELTLTDEQAQQVRALAHDHGISVEELVNRIESQAVLSHRVQDRQKP